MIPKHVLDGLTIRQWKTRKRQELKRVFRALDDYRLGCAYCPEYGQTWNLEDVQSALDQIKRAQSVASWGR